MRMKKEKQHNNLGSKQLRILSFLAQQGPHTINGANTKLFSLGHYHGTHTAFMALLKKGLIKQLDLTDRNPPFWLTVNGCGWALMNGANPKKMKEYALKASENESDRKAIESFFQLREDSTPAISRILDEWLFQQGRLETRELLKALIPRMLSLDPKEIDDAMANARKTEYWNYTKTTLERMGEQIRRVLSHE